jgi:hypothetical protein
MLALTTSARSFGLSFSMSEAVTMGGTFIGATVSAPVGTKSGQDHPRSRYSMRMPEMARAMTSCWICSVPSKMS